MDEIEPTDVDALLATRAELGPGYDRALAESFAERVEQVISDRVQGEIERKGRVDEAVLVAGPRQLALGIVSLLACIPISIVLGINDKFVPLFIALAAVVAINAAHAWQSQTKPQ